MEQKTTYRVIKTDISPNDAVIFESQNFTVANTVFLATREQYKKDKVFITLQESKPEFPTFQSVFSDIYYILGLKKSWDKEKKIDGVIYPFLWGERFLFAQFKFNSSVNNYSIFNENGIYVDLSGYFPSKKQIIDSITKGFEFLIKNN